MKKTILFALIFLLALGTAFAAASEGGQDAQPAPGFDIFVSAWNTDGANADIWFSNGEFHARVETFDCGYEITTWLYTCTCDEENQSLIAQNTGVKTNIVYDEDTDDETQYVEYRDGSAVFSIDDNGDLVWIDEKENAGEDLRFTKMGNYKGIWQCENTTINFHAIGGIYRCFVTRDEGTDTAIEWTYCCKYDLVSGNVISDHDGYKTIIVTYDDKEEDFDTVYDDCSVVFSISDDGYLIWNELKENAGDGLLFIKQTTD